MQSEHIHNNLKATIKLLLTHLHIPQKIKAHTYLLDLTTELYCKIYSANEPNKDITPDDLLYTINAKILEQCYAEYIAETNISKSELNTAIKYAINQSWFLSPKHLREYVFQTTVNGLPPSPQEAVIKIACTMQRLTVLEEDPVLLFDFLTNLKDREIYDK